MKLTILLCLAVLFGQMATAEVRRIGDVEFGGLARDNSWVTGGAGQFDVRVCDVGGVDGFLSVRTGPGTSNEEVGRMPQLAIARVDTRQRQGNWVRVLAAKVDGGPDGYGHTDENLGLTGWAHSRYMCDMR